MGALRNSCKLRHLVLWRVVRLAALVALYLHPPVSATALSLLSCSNVQLSQFAVAVLSSGSPSAVLSGRAPRDNALVTVPLLTSNPYIICFSPVHLPAGLFACITLALYVLGLPVLTFALILRDPWLRTWMQRPKRSRRGSRVAALPPPDQYALGDAVSLVDVDVQRDVVTQNADPSQTWTPDDGEGAPPILWPFLRDSGYELHSWFMRHVDTAIVLALTLLSALLPLPSTLSQLAIKLALTLAVLGSLLGCLIVLPNPYVEPWKWYLRVSLISLSMSCVIVNGVSRAADIGYDSITLSAFIAPASYINMSVLCITVAVALGGFVYKERRQVRDARTDAKSSVQLDPTPSATPDRGTPRLQADSPVAIAEAAPQASSEPALCSAHDPESALSGAPSSMHEDTGLTMPARPLAMPEMRRASGSRLLNTWNRMTSVYRVSAPEKRDRATAMQRNSAVTTTSPVPCTALVPEVDGAPVIPAVSSNLAGLPRRSTANDRAPPSLSSGGDGRYQPRPALETAEDQGRSIGGMSGGQSDHHRAPPSFLTGQRAPGNNAGESFTGPRGVLRRSGLNLLAELPSLSDARLSNGAVSGANNGITVDLEVEGPLGRLAPQGLGNPARFLRQHLLRRPSTASEAPTAAGPSVFHLPPRPADVGSLALQSHRVGEVAAYHRPRRRATAIDLQALSEAKPLAVAAPPRRMSWYGNTRPSGAPLDSPADTLGVPSGSASPVPPRETLQPMRLSLPRRPSSYTGDSDVLQAAPPVRRSSAAAAAAGAAAIASKTIATTAWGP